MKNINDTFMCDGFSTNMFSSFVFEVMCGCQLKLMDFGYSSVHLMVINVRGNFDYALKLNSCHSASVQPRIVSKCGTDL